MDKDGMRLVESAIAINVHRYTHFKLFKKHYQKVCLSANHCYKSCAYIDFNVIGVSINP